MRISILDLFSIGIGPSSSHTVGPMRAADAFIQRLKKQGVLEKVERVSVDLYGSLALTAEGHGTNKAIILGLLGEKPESVDANKIQSYLDNVHTTHKIALDHQHTITFVADRDFIYHRNTVLPYHVNGMRFSAHWGATTESQVYYSVGGGFIVTENESATQSARSIPPYPFHTAAELLDHCTQQAGAISDIVLANESFWLPEKEVRAALWKRWLVMQACVERGCTSEEKILPGGLKVKRRAPALYQQLMDKKGKEKVFSNADTMAWLNTFAMAVNEENAAGGQVVTAPTNGAAGIIPAVLYYYWNFHPEATEEKVIRFLLTAGGIGSLYKEKASISGAEVGCQGEVGVACSMAAGALTECLGGTLLQVENAAEVAMEHHLGLTCDPIQGLVQIPCIERNAMAAVRAINVALLALMEDGTHHVSLDKVIATMWRTGQDMLSIYKETSLGGLAVNHPEC